MLCWPCPAVTFHQGWHLPPLQWGWQQLLLCLHQGHFGAKLLCTTTAPLAFVVQTAELQALALDPNLGHARYLPQLSQNLRLLSVPINYLNTKPLPVVLSCFYSCAWPWALLQKAKRILFFFCNAGCEFRKNSGSVKISDFYLLLFTL